MYIAPSSSLVTVFSPIAVSGSRMRIFWPCSSIATRIQALRLCSSRTTGRCRSEIFSSGRCRMRDDRPARSAALGNNSTVRQLWTSGRPELKLVRVAERPCSLASCIRQSSRGSSCMSVSPPRFQSVGGILAFFSGIDLFFWSRRIYIKQYRL